MTETVDIVRALVAKMNLVFTGKTVTDNGDGTYTITTCDTMHLQKGFTLTIDGTEYKIIDFVRDESITLQGVVPENALSFSVYPPVYIHGTTLKTQEDFIAPAGSEDLFTRTPFIWLKEILRDEREGPDSDSALSRTTRLQMFFLTQSDLDMTTADQYKETIYPMDALAENFIETCARETSIIGRISNSYTITPRVNFGIYVQEKGNLRNIFTEELSGVELEIELPVLKEACNRC